MTSDPGASSPAPRPTWRWRVIKGCGCGCASMVLAMVGLVVALFVYLDRVPRSYPSAEHPPEPPRADAYARIGLDGFESPYLGHTGSWDGKGGGMFGASKGADLDWEVGMGLRWTFMPVYWSALEPDHPVDLAQGTPAQWAELDQFVAEAQRRRLNILMQVVIGGNAGGPPRWAGRRAPGKSAPADMDAAAAFAGKLVARYRPGGTVATARGWADHYGVRAWELDNEPNVYLTHWDGQAADYVEFARLTTTAIRKQDPLARTLLPATTGGADALPWIREVLGTVQHPDAGATGQPRPSIAPVTDGVSFHNYEGMDSAFASTPRTVEQVVSDIHWAFQQSQIDRPGEVPHVAYPEHDYWHTEGNFDFIGALSAERRAAWRLQFFTRAFAAGVAKVCVMDASKRDHAAIKAYVEALPWPFPMRPADALVKTGLGRASAFRHAESDAPDAGAVWVLWAVAGAGDARVELPAVRERLTVVRVDGSRSSLAATGNHVTIDLKGDAKMAPPVLILDRPPGMGGSR